MEILPGKKINDESLRSVLLEVEQIINSRPLTYVTLETLDDEALTPNHFLIGSSNGARPPGNFTDDDLLLRKNWRKSQQLANHFWRRWVREYLPTLTRRTKWYNQVKPITKGDVVIIVHGNNNRNVWPEGIVLDTEN